MTAVLPDPVRIPESWVAPTFPPCPCWTPVEVTVSSDGERAVICLHEILEN